MAKRDEPAGFARMVGLSILFLVSGCASMIDPGKLRLTLQRDIPIGSGKATVERVLKDNGFTFYYEEGPLFQQGKDRTNFYYAYTRRQTFIAGYGSINAVVQLQYDNVSEVIVVAEYIGF